MTGDDKGPMQAPRATRDVMKAAPPAPAPELDKDAPETPATDAATGAVRPDQEGG